MRVPPSLNQTLPSTWAWRGSSMPICTRGLSNSCGNGNAVAFPVFAGFSRKTVERNREVLQVSLRALTGRTLSLDYTASDEQAQAEAPASLTEEELIERLKRDYGATEVFDDDPPAEEEG